MRQFIWACVERFAAATGCECDDRPVGDQQAAPDVELVSALRHELHEMTAQLAWVERQNVAGRNGRACATRMEAAALRRDIQETQFLIDRRQRRYLSGGTGQPHTAVAFPASPVGVGAHKGDHA
jgi:hypothetical protein